MHMPGHGQQPRQTGTVATQRLVGGRRLPGSPAIHGCVSGNVSGVTAQACAELATLTHPHASHDLISPWVALSVYAAGFIITARIVFATSSGRDDDRLAAICIGFLWPLALAFAIIAGLAVAPTLGVKTRRDRQELARARERERKRLAARIAELEAELQKPVDGQ
jgi:membrane protein implicated in regulation of membrane protease activity